MLRNCLLSLMLRSFTFIDVEKLFTFIDVEKLFTLIDVEKLFTFIDVEKLFTFIDVEKLYFHALMLRNCLLSLMLRNCLLSLLLIFQHQILDRIKSLHTLITSRTMCAPHTSHLIVATMAGRRQAFQNSLSSNVSCSPEYAPRAES